MDRSRAFLVVTGALVAVLLVAVSTAEPVSLADRTPRLPFSLPELDEPDRADVVAVPTSLVESDERAASSETAEWVSLLIELALMSMLLGAIALVVRRLWAGRPSVGGHVPMGTEPFDVLVEVRDAIVDDAEEQRRALRSGSPRNAIVECWLRVEMLVASSGLDPDPAETSTELTARVLGHFELDGDAVGRLAALYREARFSDHHLGEPARLEALGALDAIHHGLERRAAAP